MTHARAAAGPGARESLEHGLRRDAGRGRDLERHALAAAPGDDVGERAAGVDADGACSCLFTGRALASGWLSMGSALASGSVELARAGSQVPGARHLAGGGHASSSARTRTRAR